jgi:phosphoribosylformimino-5-aminoimidazole carboxamide ribotide isomerase
MKVIPAIDLIGGKTVRLQQGEYDKKLMYEISPVEAAKKWEEAGAPMLHVVDLDGAKEGKPLNLGVVEDIVRAVKIPVETGGGYRSRDEIRRAMDKGVKRVVIGSKALTDMRFAHNCVNDFGERIIFSLDVKNFRPSVNGWKGSVDIDIPTVLGWFSDFGVKEIIYTDIKSDGMLGGPDMIGLEKMLDIAHVKIISAGGVKTKEDVIRLKALESKGLSGVIIGRALYEGTIDLKEAIDAGKTDNSVS